MTARQTALPRTWLMTDERLGARLWDAIDRLPEDSGVVFRHYELVPVERLSLAGQIASTCRKRGFALAVAADADLARTVGADLIHNPPDLSTELPFSRAAHSLADVETAAREGASLVFISPIFATRSHPDRQPLGPERAKRIAKASGVPAIAMGGLNARKFAQLDGFYGWAGIDAWLGEEGA
jgi:thiamine-phosphate pyrophosphorylase